jgi:hypothetical protein
MNILKWIQHATYIRAYMQIQISSEPDARAKDPASDLDPGLKNGPNFKLWRRH